VNWPNHKRLLAPFLPIAWLYRGLVATRNFFYDKKIFTATRVAAKVVSIGNLTVGGSGKTPVTAFLAEALTQRGFKVAIVARGYGRVQRRDCTVSDGHTVLAGIHEAGDEPLLLAQQCPGAVVVVAESKTRAAQIAAGRFQPHFILVDDGFQHRRLHRDLDLVLISAHTLLQKPWLLPAGPLREPLRNLRRADKILLTDTDALMPAERKTVLAALQRDIAAAALPINFVADGIQPLFAGKALATFPAQPTTALLVSGIALPERFRKSAEAAGLRVAGHLAYRDHHNYTAREVEAIITRFQNTRANILLTTAKDAIKLRSFARVRALPVYVLELRFAAEAAVIAELLEAVLGG
jgi:tetraacyldisaccharide 4'-kinase